jgi:DNA gyrase subunit A
MEEKNQTNNVASSPNRERIIPTIVEDEMQRSYLSYAMSVIVSRALPDVRDGLKPVHRRVLFAMNDMSLTHDKPFKKSARIVGEVLGKYHPHGDTAVYDSLVRMAQPFSLRYPLVDGQGNFGSIDGDSPAAQRYTEARLQKISESLLEDIDKDTVDFRPNFDESLKEPKVIPSKIPNLLINGASGIAVGMATNIPPHNLKECCDGVIHLINNPNCTVEDLIKHVKGPDFPTGGYIMGNTGILNMYKRGKGRIIIRSKCHNEEIKNRNCIIVDEIPYQVNKSQLLEAITRCIKDKKITDISDIRDESDRDGLRVVFVLKQDANSEVVLNQLYKHSRLQISFGANIVALVNDQPKILNLKEMISHFLDHRLVVVRRRTEFELKKAEKRVHILEGLLIALDNIDNVVKTIKGASSAEDARTALMEKYSLTKIQSQAILDMRLQKLTNLEQSKIRKEHEELLKLIEELKEILSSQANLLDIIKNELIEMKDKYNDDRRSEILDYDDDSDIDVIDLIEKENVVVTMTKTGYIKRQNLDSYREQKRGGKGIIGTGKTDGDVVNNLFITSTHSDVLFFTDSGQVHWLKSYKIPESSRTAKGTAVVNLLKLSKDEKITACVSVDSFENEGYFVMATKKGIVKKVRIKEFSRPRSGGIRAITLEENDTLVSVLLTDGNRELLFASSSGRAVKCSENDVRSIGRSGKGVTAMKLDKEDKIIGMIKVEDSYPYIFTITENGYGKKSKVEDYRKISRGGKGVINIQCSERNGKVASVMATNNEENLLLISSEGIIIKTNSAQIPLIGRNTQGVRIMRLTQGDKVKDATRETL